MLSMIQTSSNCD